LSRESRTSPGEAPGLVVHAGGENTPRNLRQFLQENTPLLLGIIRSYVARTGLARGEAVQSVTVEILQDTMIEALAHADRLNAATQPRAWFLAIAANILKRKRAEAAKQQQREVLVSDIAARQDVIDEGDFFDLITSRVQPEQQIEMDEQVAEMLSLVSPDEQEVLRLAFLRDLDTNMLAQALHISPGAARVRLHRALNKLRMAWRASQGKERTSDA
jgi:RNA polymerase sigma factor (sigma-70 family)